MKKQWLVLQIEDNKKDECSTSVNKEVGKYYKAPKTFKQDVVQECRKAETSTIRCQKQLN